MIKVKYLFGALVLSAFIFGCMNMEDELPLIGFKDSAFTTAEGSSFSITLKSTKSINSKDTIYIIRTGGDANYPNDFSTNLLFKNDTFKIAGLGKDSVTFQFSALLDNELEEIEFAEFEIVIPHRGLNLRTGSNNAFTLGITDETSKIEFELEEVNVKERSSVRVHLTSNSPLISSNQFTISKVSGGTASAADYSSTGSPNITVTGAEPYFDLIAVFDKIHEEEEYLTFEITGAPLGYSIGPKSTVHVNIQNYNIGDNLVGEYLFNGDAKDTNPGNKNHGTIAGVTAGTDRSGNSSNAYSFDGNDYISIPDNSATDFNSVGDFSISLWVNPTETQNDQTVPFVDILRKWVGDNQPYPFSISLITKDDANDPNKFLMATFDGSICGHSTISYSSTITYTGYHHLVMIKKGSKIIQYLNGVKVSEVISTLTCQTSNDTHITVGSRGQLVRFFTGKIDDLRFYNTSISEGLVTELYQEEPIH